MLERFDETFVTPDVFLQSWKEVLCLYNTYARREAWGLVLVNEGKGAPA